MVVNKHGEPVYTEDDLCRAYLRDPDRKIINCLVESRLDFHADLELNNRPDLTQWVDTGISTGEFDRIKQTSWNMPDEYKDLDIAKWILDQCKTEEEFQRVGKELLLYLERDLFPLLQYLKYLVDTMRKYNIVWGVGRGSSVSSYVLYLLGVHKINSIYYDLDIEEFLR